MEFSHGHEKLKEYALGLRTDDDAPEYSLRYKPERLDDFKVTSTTEHGLPSGFITDHEHDRKKYGIGDIVSATHDTGKVYDYRPKLERPDEKPIEHDSVYRPVTEYSQKKMPSLKAKKRKSIGYNDIDN